VAVAVGEKLGAPMVAQARNAMAGRREQENRDLTEGIEEACMAAPQLINRILPFGFHASPVRINSHRLKFTGVLPQPYMQIC
jgi:hypothetical protein